MTRELLSVPVQGETGSMSKSEIIACHECDVLQRAPEGYGVARCVRCGAVLFKSSAGGLERALAWALTSTSLFLVANSFPIIRLQLGGNSNATTLIGATRTLSQQGMPEIGVLVFLTTVLIPAIQLAAILYLLLPMRWGRVPPGLAEVLRFIDSIKPWGMVEVFMLGVLVSVVKLGAMAQVVPGIALFAFSALIVAMPAMAAAFDPHDLWRRVPVRR
jgi:paraquat-inducible protein A